MDSSRRSVLERLSRLPGLFRLPGPGYFKRSGINLTEDKDLDERLEKEHGKKATAFMTAALAYSSIGVIYGDIGTSPLYVFASTFSSSMVPTKEDILGALSVIFWILTLIVLFKYVVVVMRADHQGEGGTFALYSLLCHRLRINPHGLQDVVESRALSVSRASGSRKVKHPLLRFYALDGSQLRTAIRSRRAARFALLLSACIGISLVISDGILTPSQSILAAVEGLEVAPSIGHMPNSKIIGITIALLALLFSIQPLGTGKVSLVFSPIVTLWLTSNACIGLYNLSSYGGEAWSAIAPGHAFRFLIRHGRLGWEMLGGLFLAISGAEAMYADLSHFSASSITIAFVGLVFPSLVLTYMGQAAYLMHHPTDVGRAYWKSVPRPLFWPMLILATLASLVASQALITASYTIIRQSMNLGLFPKLRVSYMNKDVEGQIFIAPVNWTLLVLCIVSVCIFKDTAHLGNAYGVAVNMDMLNTTLLVTLVMLLVWELSIFIIVPFFIIFVTLEGTLLSSNLNKVPKGGYFTLCIAFAFCMIKIFWWLATRRQNQVLAQITKPPRELFLTAPPAPDTPSMTRYALLDLGRLLTLASRPDKPLQILSGIGIYYTENPSNCPPAMLHQLHSIKAMHEVVILLTVRVLPIPALLPTERFLVQAMPGIGNMYQAVARFGYTEKIRHDYAFLCALYFEIESFLIECSINTEPFPMDALDEGASDDEAPLLHQVRGRNGRSSVEIVVLPGGGEVQMRPNKLYHQGYGLPRLQRARNSSSPNSRSLSSSPMPSLPPSPSGPEEPTRLLSANELPLRHQQGLSRSLTPGSEIIPDPSAYSQSPDSEVPEGPAHTPQGHGGPRPRLNRPAVVEPAANMEIKTDTVMAPYRALGIRTLRRAAEEGTVFYSSRYIISTKERPDGMKHWAQKVLYGTVYPSMRLFHCSARDFFEVPPELLTEIGMVIQL